MKTEILTGLLIITFQSLIGQTGDRTGHVSYISSNNVYVRFVSTEEIEKNDTLYISENNFLSPCLVVRDKSSTSTICEIIGECPVSKDLEVFYKEKPTTEETPVIIEEEVPGPDDLDDGEDLKDSGEDGDADEAKAYSRQRIRGRVSASSYSSFQQESENRHRTMMRFSLDGYNINDSKFSFESYINYRRNFEENSNPDIRNSYFRIYNLAVSYELDSASVILFGRKINRKMSSLGAVDGLQIDKYFGNFYSGLIAGFRPDIFEYDINPSLFEYGAYFGKDFRSREIYGQFTLGLLEQRNGGPVDRRYSYLQSNLTLSRNTSLYASIEMDLYQKLKGEVSMEPRLTNLYASIRHRISRKISLSLSYDTRKRIIYYETLRTEVEELLADDISRQGIRFRVSVRPFNYVYGGISYSKRFQSDSQDASDNINGYLSYARLPAIGGNASLNFNINKSNYLESRIISLRHSRSLIKNKINLDLYFRNVQYNYVGGETTRQQNYIGANTSFRLTGDLSLNLLGELSAYNSRRDYRINTKLIQRFGR